MGSSSRVRANRWRKLVQRLREDEHVKEDVRAALAKLLASFDEISSVAARRRINKLVKNSPGRGIEYVIEYDQMGVQTYREPDLF